MAEGGALLRRYMGLNPYRGFESLPLRQSHEAKRAIAWLFHCDGAALILLGILAAMKLMGRGAS